MNITSIIDALDFILELDADALELIAAAIGS